MSCSETMDCMIMQCSGLNLAANLEKTFMLDKMGQDRIFLLKVRRTVECFLPVNLMFKLVSGNCQHAHGSFLLHRWNY